jgi:hypothetical protein
MNAPKTGMSNKQTRDIKKTIRQIRKYLVNLWAKLWGYLYYEYNRWFKSLSCEHHFDLNNSPCTMLQFEEDSPESLIAVVALSQYLNTDLYKKLLGSKRKFNIKTNESAVLLVGNHIYPYEEDMFDSEQFDEIDKIFKDKVLYAFSVYEGIPDYIINQRDLKTLFLEFDDYICRFFNYKTENVKNCSLVGLESNSIFYYYLSPKGISLHNVISFCVKYVTVRKRSSNTRTTLYVPRSEILCHFILNGNEMNIFRKNKNCFKLMKLFEENFYKTSLITSANRLLEFGE